MKPARLQKHGSPITGEELARMPGLGRSELVRGEIVLAHPTCRRHAKVEVRFAHELCSFVEPRKLGEVLVGEAGVYTRRGPDTVRGADVIFLCTERAARCRQEDGFLEVAPDLVVEVLSSGDRVLEVAEKLREYFEIGVRLVWVADPKQRTVRAYRSPEEVQVLEEEDTLTGADVLPGFSVQVRRFFED